MEAKYMYKIPIHVVSLASVFISVSVVLLFKLCRPYFNKVVTCWFCHKSSSVPYGNRNCWDCMHCDQYNGFTQDGGYNKAIPAQYEEDLNYPIGCSQQVTSQSQQPTISKLCEQCSRNQTLKVKQLANFIPTDESQFDKEVELYEKKLERVYRLCFQCEHRVNTELKRQNAILRPKIIKYRQSKRFYGSPMSNGVSSGQQVVQEVIVTWISRCLRVILVLTAAMDLISCIVSTPFISSYMTEKITSINSLYYVSHRSKILLVALITQTLSLLLSLRLLQRKLRLDLGLCILWLSSYGYEVLRLHILLHRLLSNSYVPIALSLITLIIHFINSSRRESSMSLDPRSPSPAISYNDCHSMLSDSSISVGPGPANHLMNSLPAYSRGVSPDYEPMDCATSELSSLSLGQQNNSNKHYFSPRVSPPPYDPVIAPAQFDTSSIHSSRFSGRASVHSFRTARSNGHIGEPRLRNLTRSPSRASLYSQPQIASNHGSTYDQIMGGLSTPPSVSHYRSVGSTPGSPNSTIYSAGSYVPMRVPPERTSLLTQIFLGVSLGINISIAAFILGRYSANGDLLSFV